CDVLQPFLSSDTNKELIRPIAVFFIINLESIFYHSIFMGRADLLEQQTQILIQTTENLLLSSAIANSEK
ncbi:MAG: hypothetical protein ACK5V3_12575, partial [Bdellovibrionales bacterium]